MSPFIRLNSKRKEFGRLLVYSVLSIIFYFFIIGTVLHYFGYKLLLPNALLILFMVVIASTSYLISRSSFDFVPIYSILTVALGLITFIVSLFIHHASPIIYMLYVPVILLLYILTNIRTAIGAGIVCLLLAFFTPTFARLINIPVTSLYTDDHTIVSKLYDYSFLFVVVYMSFFLIYYLNEFNRYEAEIEHKVPNEEISSSIFERSNGSSKSDLSKEKIQALYQQILQYIEEERPYTNPEFSVALLSKAININTTYISKALNDKARKKFRDFVNEYRINYVVALFNEKAHQKFTIEHIYTMAGFVQQSTFNRVFKKHTNFTPSQYIELLEK